MDPNATVTKVAKQMGPEAASTKTMADIIADQLPPIVYVEIDACKNATALKSLHAFKKHLKSLGYAVHYAEIEPYDMSVPLVKGAAYIYGIHCQRFGCSPAEGAS